MKKRNEIIQENESLGLYDREFVKRSSALSSMEQYAELIAIDFLTWAKLQNSVLSGADLFQAYKLERNLANG